MSFSMQDLAGTQPAAPSTPVTQPAAPAAPAAPAQDSSAFSAKDFAAPGQAITPTVAPAAVAPPESMKDRWIRKAYETVGQGINAIPGSGATLDALNAVNQSTNDKYDQSSTELKKIFKAKGVDVWRYLASDEAASDIDEDLGGPKAQRTAVPASAKGLEDVYLRDKFKKEHPAQAALIGRTAGLVGSVVGDPRNWPFLAKGFIEAAAKEIPEAAAEAAPKAAALLRPWFDKAMTKAFGVQMTTGVLSAINEHTKDWFNKTEEEKYGAVVEIFEQGALARSAVKAGFKGEPTGTPAAKPAPAPAVEPAAQPNTVRPNEVTIAGKTSLASPLQTGEHQGVVGRAISSLTTQDAANEFQQGQRPAYAAQAVESVGQKVTDRVAAHDALVKGQPAPEQVAGTDKAAAYSDLDEMHNKMRQSSEQTPRKADVEDQKDIAAWQQEVTKAQTDYKASVDAHNKNVDEYNQSLGKGDTRQPREEYNPARAKVPEKPDTYAQLKSDLQTAQNNMQNADPVVRGKAVGEISKANKALDGWFSDHSDAISDAEYQSFKKLRADSEQVKTMAQMLRQPIKDGAMTSAQMSGVEAAINKKSVRNGYSENAFANLLGPAGYDNWNSVKELFRPINAGSGESWGTRAIAYVGETLIGHLLGLPELITGVGGAPGAFAASRALEWFSNKIMFDPEFGSWFKSAADALRGARDTAFSIPGGLKDQFVSLIDRYKASSEKGMAGADINASRFGRAGLGGAEAADQAARDQAAPMREQANPSLLDRSVEATNPSMLDRAVDTTAGASNLDRSVNATTEPMPEAHPVITQSEEEKAALQNKEIATRRPTAVGADLTNNPETTATLDALTGKTKETVAQAIAGYKDNGLKLSDDQMENPSEHADAIIKKAVAHYKNNLVDLYNRIPESIRGISKQWYDSAHELSKTMAKRFGIAHEQAAAVIASLSPNNPWDNNVGMAERLMDRWKNDKGRIWDEKMDEKLSTIRNAKSTKPEFRGLLDSVRGQNYADLTASTNAALRVKQGLWLRIVDQAYGDPQIPVYAPDGTIRGSQKIAWGPYDAVAKAVDILENGSIQNINDLMGQGHKIRNFYNNIISPNSTRGHVTIDTHAVGAAHWKPFSQKDVEVAHNFGGSVPGTPGAGKNAASGLQGTYPVYAEAYKQAAAEVGVSPRELQSITWEGIRSLMSRENKKGTIRQDVAKIWQDHEAGKITIDQARDKIVESAGGFKRPVWTTDAQWEGRGTNPNLTEPMHTIKTTGTPAFKNWFGQSKVVDAKGNPQVVYHGTTHAFTEFKPERGTEEGHYGKGYYFSDNPTDASENYASTKGATGGPDLTRRIENLADKIHQQDSYEGEGMMSYAEAQAEAKKQLVGASPNVMPTYVKMENPVEIAPKGGTRFEINVDDDGNESGNGLDLYNALDQVGTGYQDANGQEFDAQKAWGEAGSHLSYDDFTAYEFDKAMRNALAEQDIYSSGDVLRQVFEAAGFDGIKQDAWHEFSKNSPANSLGGGMGNMKRGTTHYVVFDPTHIKSATGNAGTFDPTNPSIMHQMVTLGQGPFSITADATPPPQSPEVTAKWKGTPQPKLGNTPAGRPDFSGKYGVGLQDIADHMNVNATPDDMAISTAHEIAHAFAQHTFASTEGMAIGLGNKPVRRGTKVEGGSKSSQDGISGGYVEPGKSWNTRYMESREDPEKLKSFLKDYTTQLMAGKAMEELLGRSFTERETHATADNAMARNILKQARVPSYLHSALLSSATESAKKLLQDNFATVSHMTKQAVNHYGGARIDEATFHKYRQGGVYEK